MLLRILVLCCLQIILGCSYQTTIDIPTANKDNPASCIIPHHTGPSVKVPPGCYDYFVFSQFWSPSIVRYDTERVNTTLSAHTNTQFARINAENMLLTDAANNWVPHGLWPNILAKSGQILYPAFCTDEPFNSINFPAELRNNLDNYYTKVIHDLQIHEWEKHGTCSAYSQQQYFSKIFEQLERFSDVSFLQKHAGEWVTYQDLAAALVDNPSYMRLMCEATKTGQIFNQRWIGLDKDFNFYPLPQNDKQPVVQKQSLPLKQSAQLMQCDKGSKIYIRSTPTFTTLGGISASLKSLPPMNIGFDIDDTVLFSEPVFRYAHQHFKSGSPEFWNYVNQADKDYSLVKQAAQKIIAEHKKRNDTIHFITSRASSKNETLSDTLAQLFNLNKVNLVFANTSQKAPFIKERDIKIYYGDADTDITSAITANSRPIRFMRAVNSGAPSPYKPGYYGEEVFINSDQ